METGSILGMYKTYEKQAILAKMVLKEVILSQDDGTVQTEIPSVCSQIHWKIKKALVGVVVVVQWLSHVRVFATPWIVVPQAPLSMGFSRQEDWSGLPFLSPKKALDWQKCSSRFSYNVTERLKRTFLPTQYFRDTSFNFYSVFSLKGASPVAQQ